MSTTLAISVGQKDTLLYKMTLTGIIYKLQLTSILKYTTKRLRHIQQKGDMIIKSWKPENNKYFDTKVDHTHMIITINSANHSWKP